MKPILCFLLGLVFLQAHSGEIDNFFSETDQFLKKYVSQGNVDYASIKKNKSEIDALVQSIGLMNLTSQDESSKKAFYINAYNILVISSIVKAYPVKSPMDIQGFFDKKPYRVAGEMLTLNALEKERLLAPTQDARLHFALVCAAKSCPPLMSSAFKPDQLDKQLGERTKITINDPKWLMVKSNQKQIDVSKIFEWYAGDFTRNGQTILTWINQYRTSKIPANYKVSYYEYDWSLNGK
ncbi:MAG: DUF547 domain-containing protein [Cyclobacteriaceae bacterium]